MVSSARAPLSILVQSDRLCAASSIENTNNMDSEKVDSVLILLDAVAAVEKMACLIRLILLTRDI